MTARRTPILTTYHRERIALHLSAHGPTPAASLAAVLNLCPREVLELTNHPWFRITGDRWALAREGRSCLGLDSYAG